MVSNYIVMLVDSRVFIVAVGAFRLVRRAVELPDQLKSTMADSLVKPGRLTGRMKHARGPRQNQSVNCKVPNSEALGALFRKCIIIQRFES